VLPYRGAAQFISSRSRIGAAAELGGGTASTMGREIASGLTMDYPVQPADPADNVRCGAGVPALATKVPAPAKAGATVITLCHHEESRGATVHRQQERHKPAQRVQTPPGMAYAAARKRASKCAPEKALAVEQGLVAAAGRRAGAGSPMGVAPEQTPRKWCPLHETSLHDATACR
jgi:hypothetical protein